jgi:DNA-binding transcriptional MerR regulator
MLLTLLSERSIGYPLKSPDVQVENEGGMRIGALAERTGTSVATIRYYEQIGLLRQVARRGGQRIYDHEDARRLGLIRRCREFDFSIPEIRLLLSLMQSDTSCTEARKLAEEHLAELRRKLGELQALERTVASLVTACAATCDGGTTGDCVILQPR